MKVQMYSKHKHTVTICFSNALFNSKSNLSSNTFIKYPITDRNLSVFALTGANTEQYIHAQVN